jgi:hypothetical protein
MWFPDEVLRAAMDAFYQARWKSPTPDAYQDMRDVLVDYLRAHPPNCPVCGHEGADDDDDDA